MHQLVVSIATILQKCPFLFHISLFLKIWRHNERRLLPRLPLVLVGSPPLFLSVPDFNIVTLFKVLHMLLLFIFFDCSKFVCVCVCCPQRWVVSRQMRFEGGFQGRCNKLVDGCYSFWQAGLLPLLHRALFKEGTCLPFFFITIISSSTCNIPQQGCQTHFSSEGHIQRKPILKTEQKQHKNL